MRYVRLDCPLVHPQIRQVTASVRTRRREDFSIDGKIVGIAEMNVEGRRGKITSDRPTFQLFGAPQKRSFNESEPLAPTQLTGPDSCATMLAVMMVIYSTRLALFFLGVRSVETHQKEGPPPRLRT